MENNKLLTQDSPVEETTEENTETPEEVKDEENSDETVLDAQTIQTNFTEMKDEIKTLQNSVNYLIDIMKDSKKNNSRVVIKNQPPKEKTNKEMLFELFPPTQEYIN